MLRVTLFILTLRELDGFLLPSPHMCTTINTLLRLDPILCSLTA